ncbi:hypothetical protein PQQ86_20230 [Paraburkholderia sediminicola]|uniref:hypothetical protein n=1 Tax=Paraburkholderia sediminicola TaxID=458836 RepID=UPI0038BC9B72
MKLMTRFLFGVIVVICATTAFLHSCHLTPKQDVKEIVVSDATVWINPFSKTSPAYREAEEFHQWLLDNRKLADEVGAVGPVDKLLRSGQMVNSGMARLPTNLLEQRLSSVNKILASLDTHMCSKYIKGKMPESEFQSYAFPVIESFDDAEAKAWFFINKSAIEAQLGRSPIIVLSAEDAKQTILKTANSMYEPQSRAFVSGLANLKTESDEDACATARTLYVKGNSLPEPYRGYMARLLLTGKDGQQKL